MNDLTTSTKTTSPDLGMLVKDVLSRTPAPENRYEIAAVLESMGWGDNLAQKTFGARDIFELAETIWQLIQAEVIVISTPAVEQKGLQQYVLVLARNFLRGIIFALPMVISIFAVLSLRYSLWSYMYFTVELATSIALGTILSFMAVGGFMQAIARRGFLYLVNNEHKMAHRMTIYFIRLGFFITVLVAIAISLLNLIFAVFPWKMFMVCLFYYIFLTVCWLSVTTMHVLRMEFVFTLLLSGGIGLVFIFYEWLGIPIIPAQMVALTIVSVLSMIISNWMFSRAEKKTEKGIMPAMPRLSIVFYTTMPYFAFGFLYFFFLYIDRILAWSANSSYMPYLIWFRGEYELGLDWALLTLIIPMGLVEVIINEFVSRLQANQIVYRANETRSFNKLYQITYIRNFCLYCGLTFLCGLLVYYGIILIEKMHVFDLSIFSSNTRFFVFKWSVLSYAIIASGLMGTLVFFCLSYPDPVIRATLWACSTNIVIGFALSRWFDYSWAVFGLLAGAVVFAGYINLAVLKALKKLDYHMYAAL